MQSALDTPMGACRVTADPDLDEGQGCSRPSPAAAALLVPQAPTHSATPAAPACAHGEPCALADASAAASGAARSSPAPRPCKKRGVTSASERSARHRPDAPCTAPGEKIPVALPSSKRRRTHTAEPGSDGIRSYKR
eukprot:22707-Chlamydomonas_euryale.AAC.2